MMFSQNSIDADNDNDDDAVFDGPFKYEIGLQINSLETNSKAKMTTVTRWRNGSGKMTDTVAIISWRRSQYFLCEIHNVTKSC